MKKFILIICVPILILHCTPARKSRYDVIKDKEDIALKSEYRNDTIFLKFRFGMTQKESEEHFQILLRQKKITSSPINYHYEFNLECSNDVGAIVKPHFFNDRIYCFDIDVVPPPQINKISVFFDIVDLFNEKYGLSTQIETSENYIDFLLN